MIIKYSASKDVVLEIDDKILSFKGNNIEIIKLLTNPCLVIENDVTISEEIKTEPDLTFAKNYKGFIEKFMLERVTYDEEKEDDKKWA